MSHGRASTFLNHPTAGLLTLFFFCVLWGHIPAAAAKPSIIVYLHPVGTDVAVLVDDLPIHKTDTVFGTWCYQFNLTSFLDTTPRTVTIRTRLNKKDLSYCEIEVRQISGDPSEIIILAEKTIRPADLSTLYAYETALTLEVALPQGSVRPIWAENGGGGLTTEARSTPLELVKEIYTALQKGDVDSLMPLIDPALTDQARMEGAPPDLFKAAMRRKLQQYLIPGIPVAGTMDAFSKETFADLMAPLNVDKLRYYFMKDPAREDKQGNLYSPEEPIQFLTRENHIFAARIFFSYTDARRDRQYVSRFLFEQTK